MQDFEAGCKSSWECLALGQQGALLLPQHMCFEVLVVLVQCVRCACADICPADAVHEAFVRLHDKGLIYKGSYMVNWSPNLQTAVSDLEVCMQHPKLTLSY